MDPLDALRPLMRSHGPPLDALIVPSEDAHQSEYVAVRDQRRAYVSNFTGSAGLALITKNEALLWTDGRYFLQASQQLSDRWKLMRIGDDPLVEAWIAENLEKDATIGVDPWCVSIENAQQWELAFSKKGQKLIQLAKNLVDEVWTDRPDPVILPISVHCMQFAGRSSDDKLTELRDKMLQEKARAVVITTLDEVAWLHNLRGQDVSYNPVVQAYAIVTLQAAFFYVDKKKVSSEVEAYLTSFGTQIREYASVLDDLCGLAKDVNWPNEIYLDAKEVMETKGRENKVDDVDDSSTASAVVKPIKGEIRHDESRLVWLSPGTCSYAIYTKFSPDQVLLQQSPLALAKALKNPVEVEGFRNSHIRDGAAVVCYLEWLDKKMQDVYGAAGYFSDYKGSNKSKQLDAEKLTEITVSEKLEEFRSKQEHFMGLSFETISSVGANAAIIHYAPKSDKCAEMDPASIYLCDSGGQYLDGTTDVTRTVHFGQPSDHEKTCYTQVLQGHIALDTAVFPNGTNGHALDILARVPLWRSGLDYRHGTGHGVGSYLNVHEGPHLISFRPQARNVALQASMMVTDEPGYYEDGNFGIRLENVLIVKEATTDYNFADKGYLTFEHITWVPYQKKMIDTSLLSCSEQKWIDDYHANCYKHLSPLLSGSTMVWLAKATEPLCC